MFGRLLVGVPYMVFVDKEQGNGDRHNVPMEEGMIGKAFMVGIFVWNNAPYLLQNPPTCNLERLHTFCLQDVFKC